MRKLVVPRFKHWLSVVRRPAWQYLFALPLAFIGVWIPLRDEFLPKEIAEELKFPRLFSDYMPSWLVTAPWYWWVIATLVVLIALILEGSYRVTRDSLILTPAHNTATTVREGLSDRTLLKLVQLHIRSGPPFETLVPVGMNINRTVRVEVTNNSKITIVDGSLSIHNIDPPPKFGRDYLVSQNVSINPGGRRLLEVLTYSEGTSTARPGSWIQIIGAFPPQFAGMGALPVAEHTFQISFRSEAEGLFDQIYCRAFVDTNHVLRLSDMADSAPSPSSAPLSVVIAREALLEFIADASRAGWDTSGKTNAHIMDLLDGLRQAALDGVIGMFGRPNRNMFPQLTKNEPLNEIGREHWKDYTIDVATVVRASDNFDTVTYNLRAAGDRRAGGFVDIHLDAPSASAWLRDHAAEWKGRRK